MFFTGIADEAGKPIETQIRAHQELGWNHVEVRAVPSGQFTQVDDAEFDAICEKLAAADMQVSCFAGAIANWARNIVGDFQTDLDDLTRSIPRMRKLNCPFIRVMSWPNRGETRLTDDAWQAEALRRMKALGKMAEDGGVTLVIENCDGWAAQTGKHMAQFLADVDSPAVRVVFDTGNAPGHNLNSLEVYTEVKPFIAYVHVKDSYLDSDGVAHYTWPNEGQGYVRQILADLLRGGYDGGISIEPHLMAQVHLGTSVEGGDAAAYNTYVEYGRRLVALVESIQKTL